MNDADIAVNFTASVDDLVSGVGQAKEALSSLSAPLGEMNAQYVALGASISQSFDPARVQPFAAALQSSTGLQGALSAAHAQALQTLTSGDAKAAAEALQIATATSSGEIKAVEDATRQKIALYAAEAKTHEISEAQKLAATLSAMQDGLAQEEAILRQELQLDNLRPLQRVKILEELAQLERSYADQVQNINIQAAEKSAQEWQASFATINGAFTSQINGLLTGTTNWQAAFKNVVTALTTDLLKFFVNWGLQSVENEALQLSGLTTIKTASFAGDQAMLASKVSSSASGAAASVGGILRSIASSAAEAFAGVFGFMAPILGPAAAAPAAAAMGSVLAVEGMVYDRGAWSVPFDMMAGVHAGEMIIPQRGGVADEFRSFMSAGGFSNADAKAVHIHPTTNFHVSAVDSGSVAQWIKSNSTSMMAAMDEAVRHGAHLGLRRLAGT